MSGSRGERLRPLGAHTARIAGSCRVRIKSADTLLFSSLGGRPRLRDGIFQVGLAWRAPAKEQ